MEVHCLKVFILYMTWYNIIYFKTYSIKLVVKVKEVKVSIITDCWVSVPMKWSRRKVYRVLYIYKSEALTSHLS